MARRDYYHYHDPDAPAANSMVPAVTAVVVDQQQRLLLIHRVDNDRWALPGGGIELGESVSDAVVREVNEETGIEVEVSNIVGIFSDPDHVIAYDDGEVRQQFSLAFGARPVGGKLTNSSESTEVRWIAPEDLNALNVHPAQRLRIDHGLDPGRPPRIC
ncbi:MAG: NUDIX hydrolase [Acidimicrobiales bacterium]